MSINAFSFSSFNQSSASTFAIFTENWSAICVSYASRKCFTVIGRLMRRLSLTAHTMQRHIGPTTVALVKSTDDDHLWCAHTMRFSSFRRLWVQQKMKISWCEPGFRMQFADHSGPKPQDGHLESTRAVVQWLPHPLVMPAAGVRSLDQAHY